MTLSKNFDENLKECIYVVNIEFLVIVEKSYGFYRPTHFTFISLENSDMHEINRMMIKAPENYIS